MFEISVCTFNMEQIYANIDDSFGILLIYFGREFKTHSIICYLWFLFRRLSFVLVGFECVFFSIFDGADMA